MVPFDLHQFLRETGNVGILRNVSTPLTVKGVSIDSRTIRPGEMFVAIPGERFDGHQFIPAAREKGALLAVAEQSREHQLPAGTPVLLVSDAVQFLLQLAHWYRNRFFIPVIALTGSSGKTTTKEMLTAVLQTRYRVVSTRGNQNNFIGVPLTLFQIGTDTEVAVVEVGTNHPGEIATLARTVQPTHALITNIGSGHIGFFGSQEAIYREKTSLWKELAPGSTIFVNIDDHFLRRYRRSDVKTITVGAGEPAQVRGKVVATDPQGRITMRLSDGLEIHLSIPGRHQLHNALFAIAVGRELGIADEQIKMALENLPPVHQRMEVLTTSRGVTIILDAYNANPESMRAAIDFLCELPLTNGATRYAVLGDMLELGEQAVSAHRELGAYLRGKSVTVLAYGPMMQKLVAELETEQAEWFDSHAKLANVLNRHLKEGDVVLIKGSRGMTMEKVLDYLDERR